MTVSRRSFIKTTAISLLYASLKAGEITKNPKFKGKISITIDDPNTANSPLLSWHERNTMLIKHFKTNGLCGMLYVCGKRIDNENGKVLLNQWVNEGNFLGNHSYSHMYYHSEKVTSEIFSKDIEKCEKLLLNYPNFKRFFRFPFLKEGNSKEKRNTMRSYLKNKNYLNGAVSVDASDWYINQRMTKKLKNNPKISLEPYFNYYIKHIKNRVEFYDSISRELFNRNISHTLLLHHNLLNALFLGKLISSLKKDGWEIINALDAYKDPIYKSQPDIVPAGESIVWSCAKESGKYQSILRYPGEDSIYEKESMDILGL